MAKKLFKKSDDTAKKKVSVEKENLAVSTMPSYMLKVCGTNLGSTSKIPDDLLGEKVILTGNFTNDMFEEEKQTINNSKSSLGNILGSFFSR